MRWKRRNIFQSTFDLVKTVVVDAGWTGESVPFGADPVVVTDRVPQIGTSPEKNLVVLSFGNSSPSVPIQMGPSEQMTTIPFFIDVFAVNGGIAMSIAEDIFDYVAHPDHRVWYATDYSADIPAVSQIQLQFDQVRGPDEPAEAFGVSDFRRYWMVIRGVLTVIYQP